ncbi:hypothetical protein GGR57DRAFT_505439 [Xylariaceae sp. FL1272]|nr:hypothetical protein GGR57DRAFT_505439 [Xylariaceae sp. FL1272]
MTNGNRAFGTNSGVDGQDGRQPSTGQDRDVREAMKDIPGPSNISGPGGGPTSTDTAFVAGSHRGHDGASIDLPNLFTRPGLVARGMSDDFMDQIRVRETYTTTRKHGRPSSVSALINTSADHIGSHGGNEGDEDASATNSGSQKQPETKRERTLSESSSPSEPTSIESGSESNDANDDEAPAIHDERRSNDHTKTNASPNSSKTTFATPSQSTSIKTERSDTVRQGVRFSDRLPLRPGALGLRGEGDGRRASWTSRRLSSSGPGSEHTPSWGLLFDANGTPTVRSATVFRALAELLMEESPPRGSLVTPEKLGLLFSRFRVDDESDLHCDGTEIFHGPLHQDTSLTSIDSSGSATSKYYGCIDQFFADLDLDYHLVQPSTAAASSFTMLSTQASQSSTSLLTPPSPISPSPTALFPRSGSYTNIVQNPELNASVALSSRTRPRSSKPRVPALTSEGFVQFYTMCVLAHPDQEAKRLDRIATEIQLAVDPTEKLRDIFGPTTPISPVSPSIMGTESTGGSADMKEKLPRRFVRSLLPVHHDAKSRKLLAEAVEDLLCDLRLPPKQRQLPLPASALSSNPHQSHARTVSSPSTQHAGQTQIQKQAGEGTRRQEPSHERREPVRQETDSQKRWSHTNTPPSAFVNTTISNPGPYLPPPPVPLPARSSGNVIVVETQRGSESHSPNQSIVPITPPQRVFTSPAALQHHQAALLTGPHSGAESGAPSTALVTRSREHDHHHGHRHGRTRRYVPAEVIQPPRSTRPRARFEIGGVEENVDASAGGSPTASRQPHGGRDRDRARDHERRPSHTERRRGGLAPLSLSPLSTSCPSNAPRTPSVGTLPTTAGQRSGSSVVASPQTAQTDERGPTWTEVILAELREEKGNKGGGRKGGGGGSGLAGFYYG